MAPMSRVTRRSPCPVCGKPDWCLVGSRAAICMRVPSDRPASRGMGGWIHRLGKEGPASVPEPPPKRPGLDPDVLHRANSALLHLLQLSREHWAGLEARGLSPEIIRRGEYRTLPQVTCYAAAAWAERLRKEGISPEEIPGLVRDGSKWWLGAAGGILVPCRDERRRILGFQVRRDRGEPKYVWLSSAMRGGPSPGAPAHLAAWLSWELWGEVWITEGLLKADAAAFFLGVPVIGVPGVGAWRAGLPLVRKTCPERVVVAYDADLRTNEFAAQQERALVRELLDWGCRVFLARWDPALGKGIDDLLAGGGRPKIEEVRKWTA